MKMRTAAVAAAAAAAHVPMHRLFAAGARFNTPTAEPATPATTPPPQTVAGLRAEFSRLHSEGKAIADAAVAANRNLTPEETTANQQRFSRMTEINRVLEEQNRFATIAVVGASPTQPAPSNQSAGTVQNAQDFPGRAEFAASEGAQITVVEGQPIRLSDNERQQFSRELVHYARTGEVGAISRKFATLTTSTGSGVLLPRMTAAPLVPTNANSFRDAHAFYNLKPIETSTAAELKIPVMDATAGGVVSETASSDNNTGAISESVTLTVKTFESGSAWFSNLSLTANDFDVLTGIVPSLTFNKELGLESAMTAAMIADTGITQGVTLAGITSASMTYAKLVSLNRALPRRYDALKVIQLSQAAFTEAEGLTDEVGRPILLPDPQVQGLVRFNGTPVLRNDYWEGFGANKVIGAVFSLLGVKLRDVTVQRLARYANDKDKPDQTGLNLFAYHAYGWAVSAVAKLKCPAS